MKKILMPILFLFSVAAVAQNKPIPADSIQLVINKQNTIYVKGIFNNLDTLNLNFDTGTTELVLINDVLKNKLKSLPKLYNTLYNLKIGNRDYKTKVYDAMLAGHDTDGRFGWDLFKDKTVELNYDKNIMVVHNELPKYILKDKKYKKLEISFLDELFLIDGNIIQDGVEKKCTFLFDTGYQRTAMLDNDLLNESGFPAEKMQVVKKVIMRGAQGNEIPVITSNLEILKIGNYELKNVPVQILTSNKPLRGKNIHILGNEVLKRFNIFIDFNNYEVYIKPNRFFNVDYIEKNS